MLYKFEPVHNIAETTNNNCCTEGKGSKHFTRVAGTSKIKQGQVDLKPFVTQNPREFHGSHFLGEILIYAYIIY